MATPLGVGPWMVVRIVSVTVTVTSARAEAAMAVDRTVLLTWTVPVADGTELFTWTVPVAEGRGLGVEPVEAPDKAAELLAS